MTYVDTHCHLDLMWQQMYQFNSYRSLRNKYDSTFPASYEGCIPDWCDPTIFARESKDDEWWNTVMQVCMGNPSLILDIQCMSFS